jgi:hypothetical protein
MDAYATVPIAQIQKRVAREGKVDWRGVELSYRITARMLDSIKGATHGAEAVAWRFSRASRAAGAVHALQLCEGENHPQLVCVPRVAQLATLCAIGPRPEEARQLRHLLALVS